jgi:Protein of unknown function (DUF3618)
VAQRGGQQRDPDAIQKEIEATRAELAETIDAIADRISPKRAASRGAHAVKAQVAAVFGRNGHGSAGDNVPAAVLDASARQAAKIDTGQRTRQIEAVARTGGGAAYTGTAEYGVSRRLRVDRVLLATGLIAAVAGAVILWRSRD